MVSSILLLYDARIAAEACHAEGVIVSVFTTSQIEELGRIGGEPFSEKSREALIRLMHIDLRNN